MNAPVNTYKKVIIEENHKGELTLSEKEAKHSNSGLEINRYVELIITLEQWEQIQQSTLDIAMKIIEGLYFENLEKVNY